MRTVGEARGGGEDGEALCGAVAPRDAREIGRERGVREQRAEPAHLQAGRVRAEAGLGWSWGGVGGWGQGRNRASVESEGESEGQCEDEGEGARASVRTELGEGASLKEPRDARLAPAVRRLEHQGREALHLARGGVVGWWWGCVWQCVCVCG